MHSPLLNINPPQIIVFKSTVSRLRKQTLKWFYYPLAVKIGLVNDSLSHILAGDHEPKGLVKVQMLHYLQNYNWRKKCSQSFIFVNLLIVFLLLKLWFLLLLFFEFGHLLFNFDEAISLVHFVVQWCDLVVLLDENHLLVTDEFLVVKITQFITSFFLNHRVLHLAHTKFWLDVAWSRLVHLSLFVCLSQVDLAT